MAEENETSLCSTPDKIRRKTHSVNQPLQNLSISEEDSPILNSGDIKPYKRRWYVLMVFSYAAFSQAAVGATFGPIAQSAKLVFGWTDADIGMLANWGNIMYVVFAIPFTWVMDVKGLRVSMLLSSTLMTLSVSIRCITSDPSIATWLINAACIINGIAGIIPFSGSALLSATWFPPEQRATATAVSSMSWYIGFAIAFIVGLVCTEISQDKHATFTTLERFGKIFPNLPRAGKAACLSCARARRSIVSQCTSDINNDTIDNTQSQKFQAQKDGIMRLLYMECGVVGLLFLLVLVYFPARPPSPPSLTASMKRSNYAEGFQKLFKKKSFILVVLAYSIPSGIFTGFSAIFDVILYGIGISQNAAGLIVFYATITGCGAALFVSRIADIFMRRMKHLLLFLLLMATGATVWFIFVRFQIIGFNIVMLSASYILIGAFINGSVPLFYELGCESTYPVSEGLTAGTLNFVNNLTGVIFLSVQQIPKIGVLWMNWTLLGSVAISIPLLLLFREKYTRMDIDTTIETNVSPSDHVHSNPVDTDNER